MGSFDICNIQGRFSESGDGWPHTLLTRTRWQGFNYHQFSFAIVVHKDSTTGAASHRAPERPRSLILKLTLTRGLGRKPFCVTLAWCHGVSFSHHGSQFRRPTCAQWCTMRGPHFATIAAPQVGQFPSTPGNGSLRIPRTSAYCIGVSSKFLNDACLTHTPGRVLHRSMRGRMRDVPPRGRPFLLADRSPVTPTSTKLLFYTRQTYSHDKQIHTDGEVGRNLNLRPSAREQS